ncbi:MAG: sensor histidine kinase [Candidatus Cohnella colombiensis]|uniref:histidine kinase n=1 Tax=Candidatus Cohnella colombiensis TaxID=3121368 RepID=A0AA95EZZ7_9BACL|nr:MAG: sensor histidine kinase [Cohnella sp.]
MKLFLREHRPLIIVNFVQLVVILLIYILDGYTHYETGLYAVFVSVLILTGYLLFRYQTHRSMYYMLSEPLHSMDESIMDSSGNSPLSVAVDALTKSQYSYFMEQIHIREKASNEHVAFMNQWVHQMKTPLSVMRLMLESRHDPEAASMLEEIDRMQKGLETVLYAARLDTFDRDFKVESISLKTITANVIQENKRYFIGSKVYPELLVDPSLYVESDAKWLSFLINQLVTNAIKYSADSHQKVTLSSMIKGKDAILEIRDRGEGIPQSDLRRVFEPFFTGDNGRNYRESTGMGLYFVREIGNRLGHTIELESEVGQGTVVRVRFNSYLTKM